MFNMKTQLVFVFILFLLKHKVTYSTMWPTQLHSELNVYLQGFTLESSKVETIFECYRKCEDNINCASINMNLKNKTCALGFSPHNPILSCKWFKNLNHQVKSGVYWMKFNEPSSAPFEVFCDMTTDGGGWTLVYSYTFTQYSAFTSASNAVTPIPNWPVNWSPSDCVPQSTTTPLSESSRSAMKFALWKKIGKEFLIKSNITNWVACVEGTGSLVNWVAGSMTCRVVKAITPTCTTVAPNALDIKPCGLGLYFNTMVSFFFDGKTNKCWPAHDPCATTSDDNHLTNVAKPGGAMYLR